MTAFTTDQWMIVALVFVLGVILGMAFMASPKWKRRYREEVERREEAEAETARLRRQHDELQSLRSAADRDGARRRDSEAADQAEARRRAEDEAAAQARARRGTDAPDRPA
jgi:hypothetical protein